ncbi:MAG TPA: PaaI family thioesterase [Thermomicrobiales bacterium]|nr:PaaI family thioesterase [Thermomicrobiales bacterium]
MNTVGEPVPINVFSDHHCFGCGRLNIHGLHLMFYENVDGNGVWAPFTPTAAFEGYGGIVHGGIVCTILDEVMAWSLYREQTWAVTGQLSTRFRKPLVMGEPVVAIGKIVRDRGRVIDMRGEICRASDDVVLAEGTATFFRVPEAQAAEWNERYQSGPVTLTARDEGEM